MGQHGDGDHKLENLDGGDELGDEARDTDFHRAEEVVPGKEKLEKEKKERDSRVHEGVDEEVEEDAVSVKARSNGMRVPGVDQGEDVVVPEFLLHLESECHTYQ